MINLDAKADQFVIDENMDYITNRPKKPVETIEAQPVYEGFDVSDNTYSGEVIALFEKLMQKLQDQAAKDKFDKETMEMSTYNELIAEFTTALSEKIQDNPAILSAGKSVVEVVAGAFVEAMKNMNYSGGPIPIKNYDIPDTIVEEEEQTPGDQNQNNQPQNNQNPSQNNDNQNQQNQNPENPSQNPENPVITNP